MILTNQQRTFIEQIDHHIAKKDTTINCGVDSATKTNRNNTGSSSSSSGNTSMVTLKNPLSIAACKKRSTSTSDDSNSRNAIVTNTMNNNNSNNSNSKNLWNRLIPPRLRLWKIKPTNSSNTSDNNGNGIGNHKSSQRNTATTTTKRSGNILRKCITGSSTSSSHSSSSSLRSSTRQQQQQQQQQQQSTTQVAPGGLLLSKTTESTTTPVSFNRFRVGSYSSTGSSSSIVSLGTGTMCRAGKEVCSFVPSPSGKQQQQSTTTRTGTYAIFTANTTHNDTTQHTTNTNDDTFYMPDEDDDLTPTSSFQANSTTCGYWTAMNDYNMKKEERIIEELASIVGCGGGEEEFRAGAGRNDEGDNDSKSTISTSYQSTKMHHHHDDDDNDNNDIRTAHTPLPNTNIAAGVIEEDSDNPAIERVIELSEDADAAEDGTNAAITTSTRCCSYLRVSELENLDQNHGAAVDQDFSQQQQQQREQDHTQCAIVDPPPGMGIASDTKERWIALSSTTTTLRTTIRAFCDDDDDNDNDDNDDIVDQGVHDNSSTSSIMSAPYPTQQEQYNRSVITQPTPIAPVALGCLAEYGLRVVLDETLWQPDTKTDKLLNQNKSHNVWMNHTFAMQNLIPSLLSNAGSSSNNNNTNSDVLLWSGTFQHGLYGSDTPAIRTAGIIDGTTAEQLKDLLLDSNRVKEYNKMSLGRQDILTLYQTTSNTTSRSSAATEKEEEEDANNTDEEVVMGRSVVTKIVRSHFKPPILKPLSLSSICHAKEIVVPSFCSTGECRPNNTKMNKNKSYLIVSRGVHRPDDEVVNSIARTEMILGVNLIVDISLSSVASSSSADHHQQSRCVMINVNHIRSPMVPLYIAKRLAVPTAHGFINDLRSCCRT